MKKVKFTKDFGVKRPGDVCEYDNSLASHLINVDKVAEETKEDITAVEPDREYIEPEPASEEIEVAAETVVDKVAEETKEDKSKEAKSKK